MEGMARIRTGEGMARIRTGMDGIGLNVFALGTENAARLDNFREDLRSLRELTGQLHFLSKLRRLMSLCSFTSRQLKAEITKAMDKVAAEAETFVAVLQSRDRDEEAEATIFLMELATLNSTVIRMTEMMECETHRVKLPEVPFMRVSKMMDQYSEADATRILRVVTTALGSSQLRRPVERAKKLRRGPQLEILLSGGTKSSEEDQRCQKHIQQTQQSTAEDDRGMANSLSI